MPSHLALVNVEWPFPKWVFLLRVLTGHMPVFKRTWELNSSMATRLFNKTIQHFGPGSSRKVSRALVRLLQAVLAPRRLIASESWLRVLLLPIRIAKPGTPQTQAHVMLVMGVHEACWECEPEGLKIALKYLVI